MADIASSKPSGKYAERMLAGAWPESDPENLYTQQEHWRALRDQAREQFRELSDNASKLRQALRSDGFDALHRDRELVARNFDFLQETRDNAARLAEHGGHAAGNLRRSMAETVRIVEQEIETIEQAPGLDESEKEALINELVEATNAMLITQNADAAAAVAGEVAAHLAYMTSLPWHVSAANPAPYTPPGSRNGAQMMGNGWKTSPAQGGEGGTPGDGGGQGTGTGTGGGRPGPSTQPQQQAQTGPGPGGRPGPSEQPGRHAKTGAGGAPGDLPALTDQPAAVPAAGTGGSPFTFPPIGGPAGGAPGLSSPASGLGGLGTSGLGTGGLGAASPAQGLAASGAANQLLGTAASPAASAAGLNPLSAAGGPASALGSGPPSLAAATNAAAAIPPQAPPPAQAVPAAPTPPAQPPIMATSMPPAVTPQAVAPTAGPLGPAPPLAGPPPTAAGAGVAPGPLTPALPPPGAPTPPGPLHTHLPPVGTPIARDGLVERAEDPDIVRARTLIWELMWTGRRYPALDWAIGLHRAGGTEGPTTFFITSSEGQCYIPQHVHLPADPILIPIFLDLEFAHRAWRETQQGWLDPARIVIAHHFLRQQAFGRPVLHAIVSSREIANLDHILPPGVELVVADPGKNPFVDPARAQEIPALIPGRAHRLGIASRNVYSVLQRVPESERWSTAVDLAADAATATNERQVRTGLIALDMPAPATVDPSAAVLNSVLDQLRRPGGAVDTTVWAQLQTAYSTTVMHAQGRRHTPQDLTDDTGYIDAYRRARAYEATWLLNAPPGRLTASWLADVAYAHLCATDDPQRTHDTLVQRI